MTAQRACSSPPTCVGAECDFVNEYEVGQSPLMLEIEQRVRGSVYGATSWTTRAQAEATAARLRLVPGSCLLDLGSGAGWPALFVAKLTGCEVVITDLPLSGLRVARVRAVREGIEDRCSVLAADGAALPFADDSFDRMHHADVLCCMTNKREMLLECRRVGREGAQMEFSVITLSRAPAADDERRLLEKSGPPYPDAGADYAVLLAETGWDVRERFDVTAEFARCMDVLLEEFDARRDALIDLLGQRDYADRVERRLSTRAAVSRGLLKREVFLARNRGRS
jgi:cyclopropane fatty-acyl-phospholipid synthase-like methyltransferase